MEGRLDAYFYQPIFTEFEKRILGSKPLKDYVLNIAGGATPELDEGNKFYSNSTDGIPFLRVQNLSPEGLKFDDCKFITKETHQGMLKRSQVHEDDLLVKITGVGRMAISSVAPHGFEGNINQHIVVIKTKDRLMSQTLATFLNTDIAERMATRRSTGGTRPALDYQALLSIPIIYKPETVKIMEDAYGRKKAMEEEAEKLLASIDDYVLDELGIEMPELEDKRVFTVKASEVKQSRLDPFYNQPKFVFLKKLPSKYSSSAIQDIAVEIKTGLPIRKDFRHDNGPYPYYGANGIIGYMNEFTNDGNYLVVAQDGYIGNHYVVSGKFWASNHNWVVKFKEEVNLYFVKTVLDVIDYNYLITGGVIPKLTKEALESIIIPLPSLEIQTQIAEEVQRRRLKAQQIQKDAQVLLEEAKSKVKQMIFG